MFLSICNIQMFLSQNIQQKWPDLEFQASQTHIFKLLLCVLQKIKIKLKIHLSDMLEKVQLEAKSIRRHIRSSAQSKGAQEHDLEFDSGKFKSSGALWTF